MDVIYLDYRKAFDTVSHQRLLMKLKHMGVGDRIMKWSWIFFVRYMWVNGQHSPWSVVVSGVPQGSVLGPLLFLLFVNDLPHWIKTIIRMFADDTKNWTQPSYPVDAVQLQMDLDNLSEWSARWLLKFSPQICKIMHLTTWTQNTTSPRTTSSGISSLYKRKNIRQYWHVMICRCLDSAGKLCLRWTGFWEWSEDNFGIGPTELSGHLQKICQASLGICHSSLVIVLAKRHWLLRKNPEKSNKDGAQVS